MTSPGQRSRFQSTRPMRGATRGRSGCRRRPDDFNPRAPCGARLFPRTGVHPSMVFQSTRPMRGATQEAEREHETKLFQSTRPMRGATRSCSPALCQGRNFNPRAPCGARRARKLPALRDVAISIHAPHAGRDRNLNHCYHHLPISIHAPHAGRDSK